MHSTTYSARSLASIRVGGMSRKALRIGRILASARDEVLSNQESLPLGIAEPSKFRKLSLSTGCELGFS